VQNAPECFTVFGPAADCWALGATAFQMLTGGSLFELDVRARPEGNGIVPGTGSAWSWQCTADLHRDWVRGIMLFVNTLFIVLVDPVA
jgi:hypothetical protein